MDINRFYDYSGYDRDGEREHSENYINRTQIKKSSTQKSVCEISAMIDIEYQINNSKRKIKELEAKLSRWQYDYINRDIKKQINEEKILIKQYEMKLANLEVKDHDSSNAAGGWYVFEGDRVIVKYLADGREETFMIKRGRANIFNHELSSNTPMAKAIIGKPVGAVAFFPTSGGKKGVKIVSIEKKD